MLKRILIGALAAALLALQIGPTVKAAYYPPTAAFGPLTGDCTTTSAGGTATKCLSSNGTAFGGMAFQAPGAVAITGGSFNGSVGATTPGRVNSAGENGQTQTVTGTSGTVNSTSAGTSVSMVYVNNSSAAVALAGPTNLVAGDHFTIKDGSGTAATNNITYTPGSGITIDGASSFTLNQNRGAINVWVISATVQAIY